MGRRYFAGYADIADFGVADGLVLLPPIELAAFVARFSPTDIFTDAILFALLN